MNEIYNFLMTISDFIWVILVPLLLLSGLFFTFRTHFTQILNIPDMFKSITKKEKSSDGISGLQAFFVGLASRVGTGNIAGVSIAVLTGGPGSVFWMWVVALVGSSSAFVESTLAQLYKVEDEETKYRGGPAYYIYRGLHNKPLAIAFAVSISIAFGMIFNAVQANTISNSLVPFFNESSPLLQPVLGTNFTLLSIIVALVLAAIVGYIIFSGARTIAKISSVVVPVMASMYILLAVIVIVLNITLVPDLFALIFSSAFSPQALAGGLTGAVVQNGVQRGLFSNEAGMGSAPNAAASADVDHPVTQGFIQSLGVFVDTLLVCSATAFIVLLPVLLQGDGATVASTYPNITPADGILMTQTALFTIFGTLGRFVVYFLTIAIFFFAFSSILGNFFYSQSNIEFISSKKETLVVYKCIVLFMVIFGSLVNAQVVWDLADLVMGIMAVINIYAIVALHSKAITLLKDYKMQKANGIKDPVFNSSKYSEFDDIDLWKREEEIQVEEEIVEIDIEIVEEDKVGE